MRRIILPPRGRRASLCRRRRPQDAERLFELACDCCTVDVWNNRMAKAWWETHLMELTGPLTLSDPRPEDLTRAVAILK